jgi:hypothetical protein
MPKPALSLATALTTLAPSQARLALADAQARKADANAAFGVACAALNRVSGLVGAESIARSRLDEAQARVGDAIGAWARSGGKGDAPRSGDEVIQLQREAEAASVTASAARTSLVGLQTEAESARALLNAAHADLVAAARAVQLEEAAAINRQVAAALEHLRVLRARLYGIGEHLQRTGGGQHTNAIRAMIEQPEPQPTQADVNATLAVWQRHADRLFADPAAPLTWE